MSVRRVFGCIAFIHFFCARPTVHEIARTSMQMLQEIQIRSVPAASEREDVGPHETAGRRPRGTVDVGGGQEECPLGRLYARKTEGIGRMRTPFEALRGAGQPRTTPSWLVLEAWSSIWLT